MKQLKTPFKYGTLLLPNNIFYSPLAGCSNLPFRALSAKYRPGLIYCEMVKMEALARLDRETFRLLDYHKDMHPIGAQLVGSNPKLAGPCAKILEDMGFDAIDLNCGCPVDKVTKDGSGSGMHKTPHIIAECLSEMIKHTSVPISVKIRAGWDEDHINAPLITELAEEVGATAITIHGRTRSQAYRGPAKRTFIKACVKRRKNILVIGNGDIFDTESAQAMFDETGCDALLVSRGTLGRPWIVEDLLRGSDSLNFKQVKSDLFEHFERARGYLSPHKTIIEMRKICSWYLKPFSSVKKVRSCLCTAKTLLEVEELLKQL